MRDSDPFEPPSDPAPTGPPDQGAMALVILGVVLFMLPPFINDISPIPIPRGLFFIPFGLGLISIAVGARRFFGSKDHDE